MPLLLKGIKVLDLSRILAGPYATQVLGDLGATVIKVENPAKGDDTRSWGPPYFEDQSCYYLSANRNKCSVGLDFKNPGDLKRLQSLVRETDVLVENYKVGSLKKYQLDYESVAKINPRLIYCSITGFGQDGPYAQLPGYDALIQAMGGLMHITGKETPTKVGVAIADLMTGMYAVSGICAALVGRSTSGKGTFIDLSLFDTQLSWLANVGMNFLCTGKEPKRYGNAHPSIVPYETFETLDGPFMLAVGNDTQFKSLCKVLGITISTDPRFSTNESRVEHREELRTQLNKVFQNKNRKEILDTLQKACVPCGPINSFQDLKNDPQVRHRNVFTKMDDGKTPCLANPLRFAGQSLGPYKTPPKLNANPDASFE